MVWNQVAATARTRSAQAQQKVADGCRPSFKADYEERDRWKREDESAKGQWKAQRRYAWAATRDFLAQR